MRDSLHGSIDDIVRKKERIDKHSDIFNYDSFQISGRKLVLVEGSPGVGKTMLALQLCRDWALKKILTEYDLVFLITLRRFQNSSPLKLEDLVAVHCTSDYAKSVADTLSKSGGAKTLLILEGWDELHPSLRQEMSLFFDFVTADKLPNASVMVTSRPTVTETLSDYMDERHIEVLGFRPKQVTQYVKQNFSQNSDLILRHLQNFPNLKALAHIPLTLSIICRVVRDEHTLPSTLTELYDRYICQILFKDMKRNRSTLIGLNSVDDLPTHVKADFVRLCEVALHGLKEKRFVFTSSDLSLCGPRAEHSAYDGHGLLTVHRSPAKAGEDIGYQFNHLSIQEFLAAFQIKLLPPHERVKLLKEYRDDKQFQNVLKFLSGITKLQDKDFQDTILSTTKQTNTSQLFLVHCLYEAHEAEICRIAGDRLSWELNLNNMTLNTTGCLCAAYTVTSAGGKWTIDLRNCNIGTGGLEIFKQHMIAQQEQIASDRTDFSIKSFK